MSEKTNVLLSLFILFVVAAVLLLPWFKIFLKAGYSRWLALVMLVPIANVVLLFVFAFKEWPIEKRLKETGANVPS